MFVASLAERLKNCRSNKIYHQKSIKAMILTVGYQNKNGTKSLRAKTWMIMKLTIVLLLFFTFQVSANGYAQKITIVKKNVHLSEVFRVIEQQTGYLFFYDKALIQQTDPLNVTIKNATLEEALTVCLKDQHLTYTVVKNTVVIRREKKTTYYQAQATLTPIDDPEPPPIEIHGRVVNQQGGPLQNVSVLIAGTTIGTTTKSDGRFKLSSPDDKNIILEVSSVGFQTKKVNVGKQTEISVVLEPEVTGLSEVVVTGYSTQRKKDITGSVTVVNVDQLEKTPASNFGQQLQGKAAGVAVGTQGAPGTSAMIRIRGIGTVNNNGPLYVIDGVSTRNQDLNSINPNDIESMQILKDASSASIYGAQASNGVIIITTKKGKKGTPVITYDTYFSRSTAPKWVEALDSRERVNLQWQAMINAATIRGNVAAPSHPQFGSGQEPVFHKFIIPTGSDGPFTADDWRPDNRITEFSEGTDWYKATTQKAFTQSHNINISGANESAQYLLGLSYFNQQGTYKYSFYKRFTMRSNTQFNISKRLRIGENFTASFSNQHRATTQGEDDPMLASFKIAPWIPLYDISGELAGSRAAGSGNSITPLALLFRNKDNRGSGLRLLGNVFVEADLNSDLKFRSSFGLDHARSSDYAMNKKFTESAEGATRNNFTQGSGYNSRYVWTNTLNYKKTLNDIHDISVLIGSEFIGDGNGRSLSSIRYDYLFEDNQDTWTLDNGGTKDMSNNSSLNSKVNMFGLFARADYAYKDRYLLTGIIRRDGSSRFSASNRYGTFPSISAGWRISQENFIRDNAPWLNDLKLRAGFGATGNSEIPRGSNWATEYATNPGRTNYDFIGSQTSAVTGFMLSRFSNLDTKWETTKMLNIGIDATLFNGMLVANIEYYKKRTSDMLVRDSYSSFAGTAEAPFVNIGDMQNNGWDFDVNHKNRIGKFGYTIGVNISTYRNKVVKLNSTEGSRLLGTATRFGNITLTQKGIPISQFYGYKIIGFYENEKDVTDYVGTNGNRKGKTVLPFGIGSDAGLISRNWVGKYIFEDTNGDGKININDKTVIGNPHPDFTGGANIGINYEAFDLTASFYASVGNDIFNYVRFFSDFESFAGNRSVAVRDNSWKPGKTDATLPILDALDNVSNKDAHSYYVEDGSYLRLQTLSLGYELPKALLSKLGIKGLRIYLQGVNLVTLTKYSGVDPEITNQDLGDSGDLTKGVDFGRWPQPKQLLVGLNVKF